jgi:cell division protein FtsN
MLKSSINMNIRVKGLGRGLSVIVCTMILSGCALPVPVQIASWALDGISFLATEKSISDHGLSLVAQKDCALWRGLKGDEICSESDDAGTFAIASANSPVSDEQPSTELSRSEQSDLDVAALANFETAAGSAHVEPAVVSKPQPNSKTGERLMISGKRVWSERLDADLYFVIGSFSQRQNARRMIGKFKELGPAVMASRLDGVEVYRVAVGPFTADQKRQMRRHLKQVGIGNAWAMRVDHRDWTLASPKALTAPHQSVAEVPQDGKPASVTKPGKSDEIAETPLEAEAVQSSEYIDSKKHHLVIGSFSSAENASNFAKSKVSFSPRIISAETTEGWRHRVVIGPYAKAEGVGVRRTLARSGIDHIWALNLKPDAILGDILLADTPVEIESIDEEIAEIPVIEQQGDVVEMSTAPASSDEDMGWGVNLVEYIFDMFRSSDTTEVVGVISALEG